MSASATQGGHDNKYANSKYAYRIRCNRATLISGRQPSLAMAQSRFLPH